LQALLVDEKRIIFIRTDKNWSTLSKCRQSNLQRLKRANCYILGISVAQSIINLSIQLDSVIMVRSKVAWPRQKQNFTVK